jgi:hypothetical protein
MAAAGTSAGVTVVALLGAVGVLPSGGAASAAFAADQPTSTSGAGKANHGDASARLTGDLTDSRPSRQPRASRSVATPPALPAGSGDGKRVVFDISDQRVWLVGDHGSVQRTYLVSGSVTNNLSPGTYSVYSRSLHALGIDHSGTMKYMVRFAHGNNAAIGFHDVPVKDGKLIQTRAQLGTPESHGCIRQWRPDAQALWRFAPLGSKVVVVA